MKLTEWQSKNLEETIEKVGSGEWLRGGVALENVTIMVVPAPHLGVRA